MREERRTGPAAVLIVVLLLGLEAALFAWWYAKGRETPAPAAPVTAEIDLGPPFQRALPTAGDAAEIFSVKLSLRLDLAGRRDPARVRAEVERRLASIRSVIHLEVIGRKRPEELRRAAVLDTLALEIREKVNRELESRLGERGLVDAVLFTEVAPGSYGGR